MINYFNALIKIFNSLNKYIFYINSHDKNLLDIHNEKSFEEIIAHRNIPSFRNSAMDGYCLNSKKVNISKNKKLEIVGSINAGKNIFYKKKDKLVTLEIMTGAKVPNEFDSVIKLEEVTVRQKKFIILNKIIKKNENIRKIGEDFKINDIILKKTTIVDFNKISSLAAFGIKKINIIKPPKIFLLSTGKEITNKKHFLKKKLLTNNSSYAYIISFLKNISIKTKYLGTIKDNINVFVNSLRKLLSIKYYTIFITTGAVSKGSHDFIPLILKQIGIDILIHYVNIKPGKPILIGKYRKHIYFFCLPGNPMSSIIGLRFFILPFLNYFFDQALEQPILAKIKKNIKINIKKDTFLRGFFEFKNTIINVKILKNQESFKIKPLLYSNCFIFIKNNDIIKHNKKINMYPDIPFNNI